MSDPRLQPSDRIISYTATGEVAQFSFNFIVWEPSGLEVYINDVLVDADSYTVLGLGSFPGGNVVFGLAPASGATVTIIGHTPRRRAADYSEYVTLRASTMNHDANYQEVQIQENTRQLKRAMLTPLADGSDHGPLLLPDRDARKHSYLAFDGQGAPVALGDGANLVKGIMGDGSTPQAIMVWGDGTGLQAADSQRLLGAPNGAATLNSDGLVPDTQLPKRGHAITNSATPLSYRQILDFSDEFIVTNSANSTNVSTSLHVTNLGTGSANTIAAYDGHGTITGHTIVGKDQIHVKLLLDGTIEITSHIVPKEYYCAFSEGDWDADNQMIISPEQHGLGTDNRLLCAVRNSAGDEVVVDINVSAGGIVTLTTNEPFAGYFIIFGSYDSAPMFNPMIASGDIIYAADDSGTPTRLPIGTTDQALCVSDTGIPQYKTLGECAWMYPNIPGGPVLLDDDNEIPEQYLPLNTMSYKGTFGSASSTTGGDLPATGVLDGDIYIADSDYSSAVAGMFFAVGEWAVYTPAGWTKVPSMQAHTAPVGAIIPYAGNSTPTGYLSCNGYQLLIGDYGALYSAIGTTYNTGTEPTGYFSIPDYNTVGYFLQGGTTAGTVMQPGLPNITGAFGTSDYADNVLAGAFYRSGQASGASGGRADNARILFNASRCSAIYGASSTVQPPARTVLYLIKFL